MLFINQFPGRAAPLAAAVAFALFTPAALAADELVLKDGSRVFGTVTGSRDGVVTVDTDFAGTIKISLDKIETLKSTEPATLLLADKTVIKEQPLEIEEGALVAGPGTRTDVGQLAVLNPEPWELGDGYKWTGLVNAALVMERGNSDTDELDYKLDTRWRSDDDRYILRFSGEIDEANNEKNADNWQAQAKYDYFLTDPNYWGIQALAEKDKFQDLNLRYLVGPYYGRQILDEPILSFSAEVGASYVNEDFDVAEDQDYPAANWEFNLTSDYLGGDSSLYFQQFGIWNLDETSDVIVNSTFGLAFPLLFSLEAAAEVLLEYDSGAVDDVDEVDETYRFRIGYTW